MLDTAAQENLLVEEKMRIWMWLNVLVLASVIPLVFLYPAWAGPAMAAGGGSVVIRLLSEAKR